MSASLCPETTRANWTRRLTGVSFLLLLASTWRLWTPREMVPEFPVFAFLSGIPTIFDWILLILVAASCALWTASNRFANYAACVLLPALAMLLLLDQLRWQPWALQVWLFVAVLTLAPPRVAISLLKWLTIGIYFHAAIAKLDHDFAHTLGQQFLGTLLGFVGVDLESIPAVTRYKVSLAFPLAELATAALLCFRRTARFGVMASVAMHLMAIAILGSTGLCHASGVLLWNLWLAIQTPILFWPLRPVQGAGLPASSQKTESTESRAAFRHAFAWLLVASAILLPFSTRFGYWDTWPSWGLYAPGAERATVWIHELGIVRLPEPLRQYVRGEQTWKRLQLDRWALAELGAPLYPQNRVRVAVANYVAAKNRLGDLIRVELESPAERHTGRRDAQTLDDQRAIAEHADDYWLNAASAR